MKAWLRHHCNSLYAALARLARTPFSSLANIAVIGIALALPAGLYVILANLQAGSRTFAPEPELSVFLAPGAAAGAAAEIETRLKRHAGVRGYRFVPRDKALAELKSSTGLGDVIDSLGENPLPDAFVVEPRDRAPGALAEMQAELGRWPGITHVQLDSAWAQRLDAGMRVGRIAAMVLTVLFGIALVAVTFNTIRLQMLTRREEIEVATLMGATASFVRRPFLYFGALQGLAGGAAAWVVVWAAIRVLNGGLAELSTQYEVQLELVHLAARDTAILLGSSAALGWLGSWLSVAQHLGGQRAR